MSFETIIDKKNNKKGGNKIRMKQKKNIEGSEQWVREQR